MDGFFGNESVLDLFSCLCPKPPTHNQPSKVITSIIMLLFFVLFKVSLKLRHDVFIQITFYAQFAFLFCYILGPLTLTLWKKCLIGENLAPMRAP